MAGDFNLIYQAEDKNNTNLDRAMMGRFRRFLDEVEVKEIPLLGRKYTWSNERSSPTLVRLDRAFCCVNWEEVFPDAVLQSTASVVSDHCPLVLGMKVASVGKRRFHFESFWTKLPGFLEAVQQNWNAPVNSSCAVERLFLKLQRLSRDLQRWGQRKVGNVKLQLEIAKEILHRLEVARDSRDLSEREENFRKKNLSCIALVWPLSSAPLPDSVPGFYTSVKGMQTLLFSISKHGSERRRILLLSCKWVSKSLSIKRENKKLCCSSMKTYWEQQRLETTQST